MGQTIRGKQGNTGGMQSSQLVGGKVLVFTKGPGKRTIYAIGSEMKVKMINGLKVEGRLQANGLTNHKDPPFHVEALAVGIPMLAAGAAILPFKQVKRRTSVWRPLPMDLW